MDIFMYQSIPNKNLCTEVVCTEIVMYRKRPIPTASTWDVRHKLPLLWPISVLTIQLLFNAEQNEPLIKTHVHSLWTDWNIGNNLQMLQRRSIVHMKKNDVLMMSNSSHPALNSTRKTNCKSTTKHMHSCFNTWHYTVSNPLRLCDINM